MAAERMSAQIDDVAASWATRQDRAPLTQDERDDLDRWLALDPRHRGAHVRALAVIRYFDRARALGPDFDAQAFTPAIAPLATRSGLSRRALVPAMAAGVAVAVGTGVWLHNGLRDRIATGLGETRRIALPDGSAVTLNTSSEIELDFGQSTRGVRLIRGEALFSVLHDPRPFLLRAAPLVLETTRAAFSVRRRSLEDVEILMAQGGGGLHRGNERLPVATGEVIRAQADAPVARRIVSDTEIERRLVWRDGMIAFQGETLTQAAAEFARYSPTRILIGDPEVGRRTVIGLFANNDPVNFARAVASVLQLRAVRIEGGIRLSA